MNGNQRSIDDLPRLIKISDVCEATGWNYYSANRRITKLGVAIREAGRGCVDIDLRKLLAVAPKIGETVARHLAWKRKSK